MNLKINKKKSPIEDLVEPNSDAIESKESNFKELTESVLEKAISKFKEENPYKSWEEVDQETRWSYLEKSY